MLTTISEIKPHWHTSCWLSAHVSWQNLLLQIKEDLPCVLGAAFHTRIMRGHLSAHILDVNIQ